MDTNAAVQAPPRTAGIAVNIDMRGYRYLQRPAMEFRLGITLALTRFKLSELDAWLRGELTFSAIARRSCHEGGIQ